MYHFGSQPRRDSMDCLSPNSNYLFSPSNTCITPTQPLQSPTTAVAPVGNHLSPPRYRDNSTALTYNFEQMVNFMWQQQSSQPRELIPSGSYTDLATGMTFTYEQMMAVISQSPQSIQPQLQLQQPLQQPAHMPFNAQNHQPRTYQQTIQSQQQQQIRAMQQQQSTQIQGQMMQQTHGRQWVQHSLPQQQIQPKKHLSFQTTNTGQPITADQYGNQWTQGQYREMLRRRQLQMAQISAAMSPRLQPQEQYVTQVSPPMTASQRSVNNAGRSFISQPHAESLQCQQMSTNSGQTLVPSRSQEQLQLALPVMTNYPQQPLHPAKSDCQLVQEHSFERARSLKAQKSLLPPSKNPNAAKVPIPAKPSTQPAAHKQGVRKTQKQPRRQPTPTSVPFKVLEATQMAQQTNTAKCKATPDLVTDESSNSTMASPIRKSDMLPPPLPLGPRNRPSTGTSTHTSPSNTSSRHSPYPQTPPTSAPRPSTPRADINMTEANHSTSAQDTVSNHLPTCHLSNEEQSCTQPDIQDGGIPQPDTVSSTTTTTTTIPSPQASSSQPSPMSSCFLHNTLVSYSLSILPAYQEIREGAYPGFEDYIDPDAVVQERDPSRAPDERGMSEERAQLEWEIMVTGRKYAGVPTEAEEGGEEENVKGGQE